MADDEVSVKVSADDTGLQKGFDSAAARTERFANEEERKAKKSAESWKRAQAQVAKALVAFGAAGVAGFAAAGNAAANF